MTMNSVEARPALLAGDLLDLTDRARQALAEACGAATTSERYASAHLAALRGAAALLSQIAPRTMGSRPRSAWDAVALHAPELAEWAFFFAAVAQRSRAAQAGLTHVSAREADDVLRQSEMFLETVLLRVGLPAMAPITSHLTPAQVG